MEKRLNYTIGEGKSKELICLPENEEAIMAAFKHFGMLDQFNENGFCATPQSCGSWQKRYE